MPNHRKASSLAAVLDHFLEVAQVLLRPTFNLFDSALDVLGRAAKCIACLLLELACHFLGSSLDLVFVHVITFRSGWKKCVTHAQDTWRAS